MKTPKDMIMVNKSVGGGKNLGIYVEASKENEIENPQYLLKEDYLYMKDGRKFLVTDCNKDEMELMLMTRVKVKKGDIKQFVSEMSHVQRAECFELK